jgi:hypothetical protein
MIGLGDIAGAAAGQAWKIGCAVLAALLLVVGVGAGTGWWLAAAARDEARADLVKEQGVSAQLRAGIDDQNMAITKLGQDKLDAEARGAAAQQQAAVAGRRFDAALQRIGDAKPATCEDAMPIVNKLLEDVR